MRLIDIERLTDGKGVFNEVIHVDFDRIGGGYIKLEDLLNVLDAQPTAYDVDKVVERLERYSQNIAFIYPTDQGYDYEDGIGIDINKAKEIVNSGGIDEIGGCMGGVTLRRLWRKIWRD